MIPGGQSPLEPVEQVEVFRVVLERIEAYVDRLDPGDQLPSDRRLAVDLQVSRPVVRQALKVLEGLGRISARQGVGTFVVDRRGHTAATTIAAGMTDGIEFVRALLPVRQAIEAATLTAAFTHVDAELIASLREIVALQRSALANGCLDPSLNLEFEAALGAATHNELLYRFQQVVHELWLMANLNAPPGKTDMGYNCDAHEHIISALEAGDDATALSYMYEHLQKLEP